MLLFLEEIKKLVINFNCEDILIEYNSDFYKIKSLVNNILEVIKKAEKALENVNTESNIIVSKSEDEKTDDNVNINVNNKESISLTKTIDNNSTEKVEIDDNTEDTDSVKYNLLPEDKEIKKDEDKKLPKRLIITESKKVLDKVMKDTYEYYDQYLPEREIVNFKKVNKNIKNIHTCKITIIIEFFEIYSQYKNTVDKETSKSFNEYINYNNTDFSMKYHSHFYEKVKKCYDFINYFIEISINKNDLISLLYKSKLTYDKLFKIKGSEYEELKIFFKNRIYFLNIKKPNNLLRFDNTIKIKRSTKKETLLPYIGTKHNYIDTIVNHIPVDINNDSKIYDFFGGSLSIPYELNKLYPNNNIVVNDRNEFLINFYDQVKNNVHLLINKLEKYNTDENIQNYENLLKIINNNDSSNIDKGSVYYILIKIAYNGRLFYKNDKLSIHCYEKNKIKIDKDKIIKFSDFLKNIDINNFCLLDNYEYFLNKIKQNDIVILDPPYDILNKNNSHYLYNFSRYDQERLYIFINELAKKAVKLIIYNSDSLFIKKLYKNFNIEIIESKTSINLCKPYKELLIYN